MLRAFAEKFSRGVAIRRRLPASVGSLPLFVSPDSQLKYLNPRSQGFDGTLLRMAAEYLRRDSIVWDIGANVGVFTFAAAGIAKDGLVLAVEPDAWLAQLLRRSLNLEENRSLRVSILSTAIAAENGVAEFSIARRGRASNHLSAVKGSTQSGGERARLHVPTLTLDTLLGHFSAPTFIKVDVEGAEMMVLGGARKILEDVRPTILIEVGSEHADAAWHLFSSSGYRVYDGSKPAAERVSLDRCVWDTLAVPG